MAQYLEVLIVIILVNSVLFPIPKISLRDGVGLSTREIVIFFENSEPQPQGSLKPPTGAMNVVNLAIGEGSTGSSKPNYSNSKEQCKLNKKNEKYFYFDYIETFEEHLENFGEIRKLRFFEYMDEGLSICKDLIMSYS